MASISEISLTSFSNGIPTAYASAFPISRNARLDVCRSFPGEGWEAELRADHDVVVLRSHRTAPEKERIDRAIDVANRLLDLVSVEKRNHLALKSPTHEHVQYFVRHGCKILQYHFANTLTFSANAKLVVVDAQGNIKPDPPRPDTPWSEAYRYYRLSLTATDLYEAYRNMFLGLESLLSGICPKKTREREKRWLKRAIDKASKKADLRKFQLPGSTPSQSIVRTQYETIRVKLFHAKTGHAILPHDRAGYTTVAAAYQELVQIWEIIAATWGPIRQLGGGLTYVGFRKMMGAGMADVRMVLTADVSPAMSTDTEISPKKLPSYTFDVTHYFGETVKGSVQLAASVDVALLPANQTVGRVGVENANGELLSVASIGELNLSGIEVFEVFETTVMRNFGMPQEY